MKKQVAIAKMENRLSNLIDDLEVAEMDEYSAIEFAFRQVLDFALEIELIGLGVMKEQILNFIILRGNLENETDFTPF